MICPYCQVAFHETPKFGNLGNEESSTFSTMCDRCPECKRLIVRLHQEWQESDDDYPDAPLQTCSSTRLLHPPAATRFVPPEVPKEYAADYREATAVLSFSPKASAALGRRILQHLIREEAGIKKRSLEQEIDELIATGNLSSTLAEELHAVRHVGNFAAHPTKNTNTGEIVEVEDGEAEWILDLLDDLFHHFFVAPAQAAARRDALNAKLRSVGKPELPEPAGDSGDA